MPKMEIIDEVVVISPEGDLGHQEMAELKSAISEVLAMGEPRVVLDLEKVEHVNYVTLGVLVERRLRLRALGGDLRLAAPSDYLVNILRFAGVHDLFETHPSVGSAIESYLEEERHTVSAVQSSSWVPRFH